MTDHSTLVLIRGNSGSGKSTTAREVRRRYGRGCALLEQDQLRRVVLREHDSSRIDPVAPAFIAATARAALGLGYHVVLEGILHTERYAAVLHDLVAEHPGPAHAYYFDLSFEETVRRHHTLPYRVGFTPEDMRGWYTPRDLLGLAGEHLIPESAGLEDAVTLVLETSGLGAAPPRTPCPTRCPHCADAVQL
ncbi:putative kinase [Catenuloplanes nepalensis]|uniref:Kinase n=1 Tax=Catenuloplanes nepalensis TaxID=587533 RepID=A0ABT9MQG8_9ACTN|nr:AAA family ATPase [Catenuloplanes nepalensis]MDP9793662.1 putative kinase [Catenuloplanes nepalensis]